MLSGAWSASDCKCRLMVSGTASLGVRGQPHASFHLLIPNNRICDASKSCTKLSCATCQQLKLCILHEHGAYLQLRRGCYTATDPMQLKGDWQTQDAYAKLPAVKPIIPRPHCRNLIVHALYRVLYLLILLCYANLINGFRIVIIRRCYHVILQ